MNTLDLTVPTVPAELIPTLMPPEHFINECDKLWEEICVEVLDSEFISRRHDNTGTYDRGCRGPLCKKSYREHPRRRAPLELGDLAPRWERAFDPVLEYFHTVLKHRIKQYQLTARESV